MPPMSAVFRMPAAGGRRRPPPRPTTPATPAARHDRDRPPPIRPPAPGASRAARPAGAAAGRTRRLRGSRAEAEPGQHGKGGYLDHPGHDPGGGADLPEAEQPDPHRQQVAAQGRQGEPAPSAAAACCRRARTAAPSPKAAITWSRNSQPIVGIVRYPVRYRSRWIAAVEPGAPRRPASGRAGTGSARRWAASCWRRHPVRVHLVGWVHVPGGGAGRRPVPARTLSVPIAAGSWGCGRGGSGRHLVPDPLDAVALGWPGWVSPA